MADNQHTMQQYMFGLSHLTPQSAISTVNNERAPDLRLDAPMTNDPGVLDVYRRDDMHMQVDRHWVFPPPYIQLPM
jgi:hypothetical protein